MLNILTILLKFLFHLLAWMDNIEESNSVSGYLEGNWQPVTKEIHRAVCKVDRDKMRTKTGQSI